MDPEYNIGSETEHGPGIERIESEIGHWIRNTTLDKEYNIGSEIEHGPGIERIESEIGHWIRNRRNWIRNRKLDQK